MAIRKYRLLYPHEVLDEIRRRGVRVHHTVKDEIVCWCVFHEEDTPSLYLNPVKDVYHCFGCGASGRVSTWLESRIITPPPSTPSFSSLLKEVETLAQQIVDGCTGEDFFEKVTPEVFDALNYCEYYKELEVTDPVSALQIATHLSRMKRHLSCLKEANENRNPH